MTTSHNVAVRRFERESVAGSAPIERHVTHGTLPNITYSCGRESVILRSEQGTGNRSLPQNVIESTPRAEHPFDSDVDPAPLLLEVGPQQLGHSPWQIQRTAIPEVQSCPHAGGVYAWKDNSTMFERGAA